MVTITENEFKQLADYIKANYGIYLKKEKQTLVIGRLHSVLEEMGFNTFTEYFKYVTSDKSGHAVVTLVDKITTNHTYFMREANHFNYLKDKVLPLLTNSIKDKDLRIWCAACSSGEESYTLAMILDEFFGGDKMFWDTKVLATDISNTVLEGARKGIYSRERIAPLSPLWKSNYFKRYDNENFILKDSIKNEVIYRNFNLMTEVFPFKKKFHIIFCRNVMIYFDNDTRRKLINKFYDSLEYGGYLFIGHSESIDRSTTPFKYVIPSVYRKE